MKTFLGLPIYTTGITLFTSMRHILSTILFTGLGYFISAMIAGGLSGDVWMYIESIEKYYFIQTVLLILGSILGVIMRGLLNKLDNGSLKFFFHYPRLDKYLYPIGLIIAFLIINELFGL